MAERSTPDNPALEELHGILREVATLRSVGALLSWDQETCMPPKAAAFRAEECGLLARLAHRRATDPRIGELLDRTLDDPAVRADPAAVANLREIRRDHARATLLPEALVVELTEASSRGLEAWKDARSRSDFGSFRPFLERNVALARAKAECWGVPEGGEIYDALLDEYEPGATARDVERLFGPLRDALAPRIASIAAAPTAPSEAVHAVRVPVAAQKAFHLEVAAALGYDLDAGRLDVSTHPFTEGLAPGDTRITTRFADTGFADALGSTIHEVGHALYEQGLPKADRPGQPLAEAAGLGIHESQSRLWENQVGRSRAFWSWALPVARRHFGEVLDGIGLDEVYGAMNVVRPGLVRVEADEMTYNLHVLLRFDLERAMVRGDLPVADLPGAWNERMTADLGVRVPDDRRGCLQDIHWSMGSIGYFPTYTLGNLHAAQMWESIRRDLPEIDDAIARGEFAALLGWLRRNVHGIGRRFLAPELCERITGRALSWEPLVAYLDAKLKPLYGLD